MKNKKTRPAKSARRFRRRPLMIVAAIAVVAIAAITVASRQPAKSQRSVEAQKAATAAANAPGKFVNVKVAGQDVQVNPQTGQIRPLTPEEAQKLAEGLKGMLNKSTEGLAKVSHEDGSESMDLEGRFQNVTVARINEDGTMSTSCVDSPRAAANFLGIDRKLLEEDGKSVRPTPVN